MATRIFVQGRPRERAAWLDMARRVEAEGYEGLYVADHPGSAASPFVALAAAASVTERIQLGTCVVNAGAWEPIALASAVATLDLVSAGRAVLGIGAGHTPEEWTARGIALPSASERVARMIELTRLTGELLSGEDVTAASKYFTLEDARLTEVRPVQNPVPLLVGGNGPRVLRFAATHADIVGITGLGKLLDDGHHHAVEWSGNALRRTIDIISRAAESASRQPRVEALVQQVVITEDAEAEAGKLAEHIPGATTEDLMRSPFLWVGTIEEIRDRLASIRSEYGIERYVVRDDVLDDVARIVGRSAVE